MSMSCRRPGLDGPVHMTARTSPASPAWLCRRVRGADTREPRGADDGHLFTGGNADAQGHQASVPAPQSPARPRHAHATQPAAADGKPRVCPFKTRQMRPVLQGARG